MEKEKTTRDNTNKWTEEIELLKSIMNTVPELQETIKWGGLTYVYNGKNVLGIGGFKNYFAIWFFKGVFLKDEAGVLINAQEGTTKSLRQWRFTSKEEVNEKLVLQYVREAVGIEEAGMAIKPEKKTIALPEHLKKELEASPTLAEAFEKFSPYKQKEFFEYVESAKREETKLARVEKIKPMILEGKGLNDKYR